MPDITMCVSDKCDKANKCYRSAKSGTKPYTTQSMADYYNEGVECTNFWDREKDNEDFLKKLSNEERLEFEIISYLLTTKGE